MRPRPRLPDDQEKADKAYSLLLEFFEEHTKRQSLLLDFLIEKNEGIETALWIGPMVKIIADAYENSGVPSEDFQEEMSAIINHYRY